MQRGRGLGAGILTGVNRTAIIALWLASLIGAFLLGRQLAPALDVAVETAAPVRPQPRLAPSRLERPVPADAESQPLVEDRLAVARQAAARGEIQLAIDLVEAHLADAAQDAQALFLLSDLMQQTGALDAALKPLVDVLAYPPDAEAAARARQRLTLVINAREQQLINAGDLAGLVGYFERLVALEPGWDAHRLKLARWTLRRGELDEAARLLKEVGHAGVSDAELEALEQELTLASTALPIEHEGTAMYLAGQASGARRAVELRFLIDTGATMTALSEAELVRLGATALAQTATVRTANGVTQLPLYRLRRLALGPLVVDDLTVLGLAQPPAAADGLLGMDVLGRMAARLP